MKTYVIDGRRIANKQDLYVELGRAVNGPNGYFGNNLDALADCLRGGFGTPTEEPFRFTITYVEKIQSALGNELYDEVLNVFATSGVPLIV